MPALLCDHGGSETVYSRGLYRHPLAKNLLRKPVMQPGSERKSGQSVMRQELIRRLHSGTCRSASSPVPPAGLRSPRQQGLIIFRRGGRGGGRGGTETSTGLETQIPGPLDAICPAAMERRWPENRLTLLCGSVSQQVLPETMRKAQCVLLQVLCRHSLQTPPCRWSMAASHRNGVSGVCRNRRRVMPFFSCSSSCGLE